MTENDFRNIVSDIQASPKECEWVEVKVDNENPELVGEYISALSNGAACTGQAKAYLAYGIENETHQIVGTPYNPKMAKKGNCELENWWAVNLDPRIDFSIHEGVYDGKRVVLFEIDSAKGIPVKFKGKAYIRIGSYKKSLSEHPERERKIWQNSYKHTFETGIAKKGVSSDEVLRLIDYSSLFRLLKIPLPENKTQILEKLAEEKIINTRASCFDITNMGAILFATELKEFSALERKAIRVIFYKDNTRLNASKDLIGQKGYASGFEGLINYVEAGLPSNEEIGKVFRKDILIYPKIAIREFVANALIHQDFSVGGTSPMIEVFPNRLEITNPGEPLIDTLRFIDHPPISRNEKIASMMRRMNFCEERGSGVDRALIQCEIYQLPAPEFLKGDGYTKIVMFTPKTMRQMNKSDKIRACYQHCCLKYIAGEKMTNGSFRSRLNIEQANYSIASRIISDTIAEKLIKLDDVNKSRKYAKYVPVWA